MKRIIEKKIVDMKNPLLQKLQTDNIFKEVYYKLRDEGYHIYAISETPDQWSHLTEEEREIRIPYLPICSLDEIKRILHPINVSDLLLCLRANSIISNIRILRTFEKRACYVKESEWKLTDQFDDSIFKTFDNEIHGRYKKRINEISFGTIFSDNPNGFCIKTNFGSLTILSEALNKFFYFMNLGFYNFWDDMNNKILQETQYQSIMIGIRTMLLTESFDFELDPRGIIPEDIDNKLQKIVTSQMLFVIAHEYAHFLLNHLDDKNLVKKTMSYVLPSKPPFNYKCVTMYNQSQTHEFEADSFAIEILCGNDKNKKRNILLYGVTIMSYFDIFESLINKINNRINSMESHPPAYDRLKRIIKIGKKIWNKNELKIANSFTEFSKIIKKNIIKFYNENPSNFTTYGSGYLVQWRDKPKIDRIDY